MDSGRTTMRRVMLSLTFITFLAWSQPAQRQAQPPVVVRVELPLADSWTQLGNLAPGIITALNLDRSRVETKRRTVLYDGTLGEPRGFGLPSDL
jgi:hypothetical protein